MRQNEAKLEKDRQHVVLSFSLALPFHLGVFCSLTSVAGGCGRNSRCFGGWACPS